ncbi:Mor transcription activator family protein [Pseudacidovorax sp. 1753]|uniref:Mor transcription activator family protein n=1 Tax=Pseudacidovorax sp. 1753 TaxID=3156419 RepID=UPI00339173EA
MKNSTSAPEDPLSIIENEARAVAILYGAEWCGRASETLMRRLVERLGGVQVYIPRITRVERATRDTEIRSRFNGKNLRQLARDYSTSERTIRRVVSFENRKN